MKTNVTFRHLKSSPELKEKALESVNTFEKFYDGIISANVEFINEAEKSVAFTVHINGTTLVARESADDFVKSLNVAEDKIVRQLRKWKTKAHNVRN